MLLKFFKRPLPRVLVVIMLIGVLLWLKGIVNTSTALVDYGEYPMPLFRLVSFLVGDNFLVSKLVSFLLVATIGLYLIQVNTRHMLLRQRTYLPALFYILLASAFLPLQTINPAVFAALLMVGAIDYLFLANSSNHHLDNLFKAGFLVSLATLFYLPSAIMLIVLFFSIVILNHNGIRPWLSTIFGFVTPWFFVVFYSYFFYDDIDGVLRDVLLAVNALKVSFFFSGIVYRVFYGFLAILLLVGGLYLLISLPTQKILIRKHNTILVWIMVWFGLVAVFPLFRSSEIQYLIAIPISFLFSNFFSMVKSRFWGEALFLTLLVLVVVAQVFVP